MKLNHQPHTYGDAVAEVYDEIPAIGDNGDAESCVDFLSTIWTGGPLLELGIGTGRIAIPLAQRGFDVTGVDISDAIVDVLRAKPEASLIKLILADLTTFTTPTRYPLAFFTFDSIALLTTQEQQVQCFQRTAEALTDDGVFIVHAYAPFAAHHVDPLKVLSVDPHRVVLQASMHDPIAQQLNSSLVVLENDSVRLFPLPLRYVWPSELDLMAQLAGFELKERWGGWSREPFTATSKQHVSVYTKKGLNRSGE